jgi:hypothetical protein
MTISTDVPLVDLLPEQYATNEINCSFYGCNNSESVFRVEDKSFFDINNFGELFHQDECGGNWSRYRDSEVVRRDFDSSELMNDFINSIPNSAVRVSQDSSQRKVWWWNNVLRFYCPLHTYCCNGCNDNFAEVVMTYIEGDYYCGDCRDDGFYYCDNCEEYKGNPLNYIAGDNWCDACIEACGASWCDYCNEYEIDLCDANYDPDDVDVWTSRDYDGIMNYNFKPSRPDFFMGSADIDDSRLFYGMELEVESMDNSMTDGMKIIKDSLNEFVYFKADGSLDRGYELVTFPFTFNYYSEAIDFKFLSGLQELGYRSWSANTCGLHVHISRTGFASSGHIWKFAQLILSNQYAWSKLAGRTSSRWASFDSETNSVMKVLKGEKFPERYCAVNLSNTDTIEVRIFRGSLNERRVRSAIESVDCAIQYTRSLSVHDINNGALKFGRFADWVNENRTECASFIDLMCEYGLIPMVKKAELADVGIESEAHFVLSEDVDNSQRSLSVLTDIVDVPPCPNSDLHAELEN